MMTGYPVLEGGCDCGRIRYRMLGPPLIVHCCHCRWCQRETGASFALNAMIETDRITLLQGMPEVIVTPSHSGRDQKILRCPDCRLALWSHYAGGGNDVAFVRVGTLDEPDRLSPDIHIYVESKQPWVVLPEGARCTAQFYDIDQVWSPESLVRRQHIREKRAQHPG
ncbi:GFA family protein [Dyella sp. C9]|uniref:GFA family protein n=1 Tax=Dyella sp. C9 TaxID=2202154 RepID=UPI000DEF61E6|nr:GFA family protein [Dyella sp. C9]